MVRKAFLYRDILKNAIIHSITLKLIESDISIERLTVNITYTLIKLIILEHFSNIAFISSGISLTASEN